MISSNFAVAVVTVVLRGLLDRVFAAVRSPVVKTSVVSPSSTTIIVVSGIIYFLYNRLTKGNRIQVCYSVPNRRKVLDGRLHKNGSQSSSASNLATNRSSWSPRKYRRRSRSRCRTNLVQAAKDSVQMLHRESSTCTISSRSENSSCACKDCVDETKERSPSIYTIKSEDEHIEKNADKNEKNNERFKGYGDCDWQDHRPKVKKRKRIKTTRKTRSGKIYSFYL